MDKKVAIITGGVKGIGRAIAEELAGEGYVSIISDIDKKNGKEINKNNNKNLIFKYCDVSKEDDIKSLIDAIMNDFGRIDVLVNNAGVIRRRNTEEIKIEDWDIVFKVNIRGSFIFCKYVSEIMKQQDSGKIVNISSIAGKVGDITSAPGYGPSKSALNGLTKTFAREMAPYNVNVNAIAPHAIATDMSSEWSEEKRKKVLSEIPLNRLGQPSNVAATVLFLISQGADFITGEIIDVNGGYLMD